MIFDTDVLIWALRGNAKAAAIINLDTSRAASVISHMELLQGARDKSELATIRRFLQNFETLPLSDLVGHRAAIYMEQFVLKSRLSPMDAIIAATAADRQLPLCTGNVKHFRSITEIEIHPFKP